jgi:hypothetical protein
MSRPKKQMEPLRLCDAAEAVMIAVVEVADQHSGKWPYPPDLMGSPNQPAVLAEFTRDEIVEATDFLVRLGFLETARRAA